MLIKICGITSPDTAIACFEAGADMIGLVYYPPSPRHIDETKINEILDATTPFRQKMGRAILVAVDHLPSENVTNRVDGIQIYREIQADEHKRYRFPSLMVRGVRDSATFSRFLETPVKHEHDRRFLLELSEGILPGGNGASWDWSRAKPFCERHTTLLAGGITPENAVDAIRQAGPYGIDVSSGVESAPGIKDMEKVRRLIENVRNYQPQQEPIE